jgi:hypothetical protein
LSEGFFMLRPAGEAAQLCSTINSQINSFCPHVNAYSRFIHRHLAQSFCRVSVDERSLRKICLLGFSLRYMFTTFESKL